MNPKQWNEEVFYRVLSNVTDGMGIVSACESAGISHSVYRDNASDVCKKALQGIVSREAKVRRRKSKSQYNEKERNQFLMNAF